MYLKQSTAVTVKLGPFVDAADGATAEAALTIQKANVRLSKNGANIAAANADQGVADAGAPYDEIGYYDVSLDATDTNTLGRLQIMVSDASARPVIREYLVLPAAIYDAMVSGTVPTLTTVATTLPEMLVQLWRRFFKRVTLTAEEMKTFAEDGSTVVTTQLVSDTGSEQSMEAAS